MTDDRPAHGAKTLPVRRQSCGQRRVPYLGLAGAELPGNLERDDLC